ncbi:MAG: NUDIX hydrolase [Chlamydiae bacterium]|nr:NUDIX hydrolase [Chlamydiota bacterium]
MTSIRHEIHCIINSLAPFDEMEQEHISFTKNWIESGAEIFRTAKPATPDPHLVAYFLLIDSSMHKVLLVDHKKAGLWLPAGGHVEPNEHPKETVRREILEELRLEANFMIEDPIFLTVTKTVGQIAQHTDVSFWYLLKGNNEMPLQYDQEEFNDIRWFDINSIPYENTDPHMRRFIQKLLSSKHELLSKIQTIYH